MNLKFSFWDFGISIVIRVQDRVGGYPRELKRAAGRLIFQIYPTRAH